jgi:hypothetical protein
MNKTKAELETVYRASLMLATIDLVLATVCAINGNSYFAGFMVLAGAMWAYGMWFKSKAEQEGE